MTSPRRAPAKPAAPASETWEPARLANTAPSTAAPTAPPRPRKKPVTAIAMPSSRRSTVFWTAVIRTWVTIPKPSPKTIRPSPMVTAEPSGAIAANSPSATVINTSPATGKRL
jgi:hypothetical protein